jgi:hypothetical protein
MPNTMTQIFKSDRTMTSHKTLPSRLAGLQARNPFGPLWVAVTVIAFRNRGQRTELER